MKNLIKVLAGIGHQIIQGKVSVSISSLEFDSRKVVEGSAFVAIRGVSADGHDYIEQALDNGASVIISEKKDLRIPEDITQIVVENTGKIFGQLASNFYDNPSDKLHVVGVTGTNGKTTIVTVLYQLFKKLGHKVGLLSTIKYLVDGEEIPSTHSTPDALQIHQHMAKMVDAGCEYCFMECSSHAIDQDRVAGIKFAGGIFTNFTQDHLDYHKTLDNYFLAKKKFFDSLSDDAFVLTNIDDERGREIVSDTRSDVKTYSLKDSADFNAEILEKHIDNMKLAINDEYVEVNFSGTFNAYNLLAVYGVATLLGENPKKILEHFSELKPATGRFEIIKSQNGIYGIVDYAHTPDAIKNVLEGINDIRGNNTKIITVIGAGGDRDKTKRSIMGREAVSGSDFVILTSDNPRSEDPQSIIEDMKSSLSEDDFNKVLTIVNREGAIQKACKMANPGDIIAVLGKGHENYQEINGTKNHFDDKEIINKIFYEQ